MSGLLGNLVAQVAQSALNGGQQQPQGGMGDLLGGMLGGATGGQQSQGGMGDLLGGVLASQMNGNQGAGGLGSILGSVLSGGQQQAGGNQGMLMAMLMPMVLSWIQSKGGLGGALSQIQNMGFGEQANSWVSANQQNVNLGANEVQQLFDSEQISQIATQAGVDQDRVSQSLGALLPEVMNQLTPQGGIEHEQEANQEIGDILSQLRGLM